MKIAVTAASGKLGSAIVNQLKIEIGAENVVGIARTPLNAKHLEVEIRKGDYENKSELEIALKEIDIVLMVSGMDDPKKRVKQHRNVIAAAKKNGVKKIVYTSIIGDEDGNSFKPIVNSNRKTEDDVKNSGMDWVIGRNSIYIEPDLDYLSIYKKEGEIRNSAGTGKCTYTSRNELAYAYTKMLTDDTLNGKTYNLAGGAISQTELAELINKIYGTSLVFNSVSEEEYEKERKEQLGDFLGGVISGIYKGIKDGKYDIESDFEKAAGRKHKSTLEMIQEYKARMKASGQG